MACTNWNVVCNNNCKQKPNNCNECKQTCDSCKPTCNTCNNSHNSNEKQCDECRDLSQRADHEQSTYWSEHYHNSEKNWEHKKCVCPPFGTSPKYYNPPHVPCDCRCKCWCNNKCNCGQNCCPTPKCPTPSYPTHKCC